MYGPKVWFPKILIKFSKLQTRTDETLAWSTEGSRSMKWTFTKSNILGYFVYKVYLSEKNKLAFTLLEDIILPKNQVKYHQIFCLGTSCFHDTFISFFIQKSG